MCQWPKIHITLTFTVTFIDKFNAYNIELSCKAEITA